LPLTFSDLKEFASMAYERVENKILDWNVFDMGLLSHVTAPLSNSQSASAKYGSVVESLDELFVRHEDVLNEGLELVIFSKQLTDRATKVVAGSSYSVEAKWVSAAVKLGNEALMIYKRTKVFPGYLDAFEFTSSDWAVKRTSVLNLFKLVTPKKDFEASTANDELKACLRSFSGEDQLPDCVRLSARSSAQAASSQPKFSDQSTEWVKQKRCLVRVAGTTHVVEKTIDEVKKQIQQGVQFDIKSTLNFGNRVKHQADEWFALMGLEINSIDLSVVKIIDSQEIKSSSYLKNFYISEYQFDEEEEFKFDEVDSYDVGLA
jgi:hypothetical protein